MKKLLYALFAFVFISSYANASFLEISEDVYENLPFDELTEEEKETFKKIKKELKEYKKQIKEKSKNVVCTMEYAPVCGVIEKCNQQGCYKFKRTFSNKCFADAAGAIEITPGACDKETEPIIRPIAPVPITKPITPEPKPINPGPKPVEGYEGAQHCPKVYEPVCVISKSSYLKMCKKENGCSIYEYVPNKCVAETLGLKIVDEENCVDYWRRLPGKPNPKHWDNIGGNPELKEKIPENCKTYFDGCNTCTVEWVQGAPRLVKCTMRYCPQQAQKQSKCISYYSKDELKQEIKHYIKDQKQEYKLIKKQEKPIKALYEIKDEQLRKKLIEEVNAVFATVTSKPLPKPIYNKSTQEANQTNTTTQQQESSATTTVTTTTQQTQQIKIKLLKKEDSKTYLLIKKPAKLFGIFPINLGLKAEVDEQTQEVEVKLPWWSIFVW